MATREQLIEDFADHKYATGEKFERLINSMKVVQEPVETPAASGTSLSFIDSIEQDKDGKITATKKTLDLANAHELNPFKGWWKTGDTLPTSGFDGAYLYFKDTTQTPAVTTIYQWNGTAYAPTGTVVDESNVNTFGSGQQVNAVKIKDASGQEVTGSADVLSASAGRQLIDIEITNLTTDSPYFVETLEGAYIPTYSRKITSTSSDDNYCISLFRLPVGDYKATKVSSTSIAMLTVCKFASMDDFVVGGSSSEDILLDNASAGTVVDFTLAEETLVALVWRVSGFNKYATLNEVEQKTLRETVEGLGARVDGLEEELSNIDVEGLGARVDGLEEAVFTNIEENLTTDSPYFVETLEGAYIPTAYRKIASTPSTVSYRISLFRLPVGDYKATKVSSTSVAMLTVCKFASMDDFVVGGSSSEDILLDNASAGTVVDFTLAEETLVALVWSVPDFNKYATLGETVRESSIPSQVEEAVAERLDTGLEIVIPNVVYALVGTELNVWNDTVSLSIDKGLMSPMNYHVRWSCSKGLITDRCFRFTPNTYDAGHSYNCTCYLYDMTNRLIASKTFAIKVLAKDAIQSAKKIAYFGDSLGSSVATKLYDDFNDSNKYTGVVPQMVGTRGTTVKYDAVGGYEWSDYATEGREGYRAEVSGVTSISLFSVYTDGVANFEVIEVNLTNGSGNILLQSHYSHHGTLIMPSGTLTLVSGSGDDSIPYTNAFAESANPLWNETEEQLDVSQYKQLVGLQTTDKIDAVSFQFGVNEAARNHVDDILTYIDSLYNCFVGDNPNCKFIIGLNTSAGNDVNGAGVNYGATFDCQRYLQLSYNIRKMYLALQNNANYPNIRIAPIHLELDRYYGYAFSTRQISQRYTENEQYHNNYVHPGTSGYGQMADAYLAFYVGVLTEA